MAIKTYAMGFMSRWQSAVLSAIRGDDQNDTALASEHPVMRASCDACEVMEQSAEAGNNPLDFAADVSKSELVSACARMYLSLALAKTTGDHERASELEAELQFSVCDPLWAKALLHFDDARVVTPYRHYESLDDFVLPLAPDAASSQPEDAMDNAIDKVRVAFVSDWATGTSIAKNVMRCVGAQNPDIVIHLGDVYYSGTKDEMDSHFLSIVREMLPAHTRVFNLAGNHDLYAGGEGYYWLIDELGQPASYFCLRNSHWQILAIGAPPEIGSPLSAQAAAPDIDPKEADWQRHKIESADGRKTVMLSHYQLFTASGNIARSPDNRPLAVNPVFMDAFGNHLGDIDIWLWGHEHNLALFEPYAGLERGRCIGSGSMPVALMWEPYKTLENLALPAGFTEPPIMSEAGRLGHDGDHYHHAFCVLDIEGPSGAMTYFQVPGIDGDAEPIHTEQL